MPEKKPNEMSRGIRELESELRFAMEEGSRFDVLKAAGALHSRDPNHPLLQQAADLLNAAAEEA